MARVPRHKRMTEADKERKVRVQKLRRMTKPAMGKIRYVLGDRDYLTLYNRMLAYYGGCAICEKDPTEGKRLHMDHDHETGEIRGLLCYSCNTKLGFYEKYKDQIDVYMRGDVKW